LRETSAIGARKPEDAAEFRHAARWDGARAPRPDRVLRAAGRDDPRSSDARNLELVEASSGDDARATLLAAIDETATGMGARLLRSWVLRPEISIEEIERGSKRWRC